MPILSFREYLPLCLTDMELTKEQLAHRAHVADENRQTAERIRKSKQDKEEAERLKQVEKELVRFGMKISIFANAARTKSEIDRCRESARIITDHPMFRSKAGYFSWQLSALNFLFSMAMDIITYLMNDLHNMQKLLDAVKEVNDAESQV